MVPVEVPQHVGLSSASGSGRAMNPAAPFGPAAVPQHDLGEVQPQHGGATDVQQAPAGLGVGEASSAARSGGRTGVASPTATAARDRP